MAPDDAQDPRQALITAAATAGRLAEAWAKQADPESGKGGYASDAAIAQSLAETSRKLAEAAELLTRAGAI